MAATWHFLATMGAIARWTLVAAAFVTILIMTWELMAVLRAVFLGQIEGRPMGVATMPRATNRAQAARAPKARARFNAMGAGSSFLWIVLISLAMAETLQRLILMIHKASVKLPKTGLNKLTVIDCGCVSADVMMMKPAESRTCVDAFGYVCQVRVSEWPSIMFRVSSGCFTCRGAFMRTIVLVAAALAALPLTSIRAHADGAWCARDSRGGTNCGFHTYNRGYQTYSRGARRLARDWQY